MSNSSQGDTSEPYRVVERDSWYHYSERFDVWRGNKKIASQCTEANAKLIVAALKQQSIVADERPVSGQVP